MELKKLLLGGVKSVARQLTLLVGAHGVFSKDTSFLVLFILSRAIHPLLIDESKTRDPTLDDERKIRYSPLSAVIVMNVVILVVMQLVTLWGGGMEQWRSIWTNRRAWQVFAALGMVLALGDWLEMLSMGGLSGSVYQILLQSKFVVTAVMMMYFKGTRQTCLQWILLTSLMSTMTLYMNFAPGGSGSSSSASIPWFGMAMAVLKVVVSCLGAVMSDKCMKDLKDLPTHVQLVQMGLPRLLITLLLSCTEEGTWEQGLLHHWDVLTVGVSVSFVLKSVTTLYLLAVLDALHKNIGETLAILFIYAWEIGPQILCVASPASPYCEEQGAFDVPRLIAVFTVVLVVAAYLKAKVLSEEKAKEANEYHHQYERTSLTVAAGESEQSVTTIEVFQRLLAFDALAQEQRRLAGRCGCFGEAGGEAPPVLEAAAAAACRAHVSRKHHHHHPSKASCCPREEGPEQLSAPASLLADLGRVPRTAREQRWLEMVASCRGGQAGGGPLGLHCSDTIAAGAAAQSPCNVHHRRCTTAGSPATPTCAGSSPLYHRPRNQRPRGGGFSMTP